MADGYYWTPNVDMTDYYSGAMMPPTVSDYNAIIGTPGATGKPRDMSPESIYQSIYGEPLSSGGGGGLTSRKVNTVAIDPSTGMPPRQQQVAANPLPQPTNYYNPGNMYKGPGSAAAGPKIGTGPEGNRLTPNAMGYNNNTVNPVTGRFPFNYPPPAQNPAVAAINATVPTIPRGMQINNRSRDSVAFAQAGKNAVANMPPVTGRNGSDIIDLGDAFGPKASQSFADSEGKPVRVKGVVYYPGGRAPVGAPQARNAPVTQQRSGGLGGLFGSIFGGGAPGSGRAALESGWTAARSSIGNSPDQGKAMVVSPGTASGSVLSGMGFSDGALVPAATIRGLESRGYFK